MQPKLAIISGGGRLPVRIASHCRSEGREFIVIALKGNADPNLLTEFEHEWVRIGAAGKLIRLLKKNNIKEIVMVGSVKRPSLFNAFPDLRGIKFIILSLKQFFAGDNAIITSIIKEFEGEGFNIIGIDNILEELLTPLPGVLGAISPTESDFENIYLGIQFARDLGSRDLGQAVVVGDGELISVEDKYGTNKLISASAKATQNLQCAVLVKTLKPNQERRVDLPTIGCETIELAFKNNFAGVAVEAKNSLIVDREQVIRLADKLGLFLVSVDATKINKGVLKIAIIAGEASGDIIGSRLMTALNYQCQRPIKFYGVGGPQMQKKGLESLFPISEIAYTGFSEVLPNLLTIISRIRQVASYIDKLEPEVLITIDCPDFSLRVAKKVKSKNTCCIHYVAPSVWAWKPGRAKKMAKYLDLLLTLFPFEIGYFGGVGLKTECVGHSVMESGVLKGIGKKFRNRNSLADDALLICLLPGSRLNEVKRHLPIMEEVIHRVHSQIGQIEIVIPVSPIVADTVKSMVKSWEFDIYFTETDEEKYNAMAASNVALAASGTVCLELALANLPNVTMYKMSWITNLLANLLVKTKYVNLVNVLFDREIVPELLLMACTPSNIASKLLEIIQDSGIRQKQSKYFSLLAERLQNGEGRPSEIAAKAVLKHVT